MDYEGRHIWEIGEPAYFLDPNISDSIVLTRGIVEQIHKDALRLSSTGYDWRIIPLNHCYPTAKALYDAMMKELDKQYDKLMQPILNKKGKKSGRSK